LFDIVGIYVAGARIGVVKDQAEDFTGDGNNDFRGLGFATFQAVGEKGLEIGAHRG